MIWFCNIAATPCFGLGGGELVAAVAIGIYLFYDVIRQFKQSGLAVIQKTAQGSYAVIESTLNESLVVQKHRLFLYWPLMELVLADPTASEL